MRGNAEASRRPFPVTRSRGNAAQSGPPATKLRRPPSPFYLFIHHAEYRKWASSKIILGISPILPSRFKGRMRRRIMKHRGAAARLAQRRDAIIAQLTVSAREIFLELEALHANALKSNRKT